MILGDFDVGLSVIVFGLELYEFVSRDFLVWVYVSEEGLFRFGGDCVLVRFDLFFFGRVFLWFWSNLREFIFGFCLLC